MKTKVKKPKTQIELVHQWCNGLIDNHCVNSVEIRDDILYYHASPVATIIKGKLFIEEFNGRGSYGNGLIHHDIVHSFNGSKRAETTYESLGYYTVHNLATFLRTIKGKEKEKLAWAIDEFKHQIYDDLKNISNAVNRLKSKRNTAFAPLYFSSCIHEHEQSDLYNITRYDRLDVIPYILTDKQYEKFLIKTIEVSGYSEFYTGWSRYDSYRFNFKFKIRDYINNPIKAILTPDEIKELEFRIWRKSTLIDTYFGVKYSYDEAKMLWEDPRLRPGIEERVNDTIKRRQAQKELKDFTDRKKRRVDELRSLIEWKNGNRTDPYNRYGWTSSKLSFLRLHKTKEDNLIIQTSMGVSINLKDGIRLYKLIKNIKQPKELLRLKLQVGGYYVRDISNVDVIDYMGSTHDDIRTSYVLCLRVGCHNISLHEINRFVKTNNILQYDIQSDKATSNTPIN